MDIHYLNDDCLLCIFQYLSIADRIKIERVCKHWQIVSKRSWYCRKSLNPFTETCGLNCRYKVLLKNPNALYEILKRCGRYLKTFTFIGYTYELKKVGSHIGTLCPNLRHLELNGGSKVILRNIAENCQNIRSLCLQDTSLESCEDEISMLFSKNKKLQTFELISEFGNHNGDFWLNLPAESIRTLNILNSAISKNYFIKAVREMKNLSKLSFDFCEDFDDELLEAVCSLASLREVQTGVYLKRIKSLNPIFNLENLKIVELSQSHYVNDEFLTELSKRCLKLEDVDVSGCSVTDVGVTSLTRLPKIERLVLNNTNVTGDTFHVMPKLKDIECCRCENISDICLSRIITTSVQLEILNICYCEVYNWTVDIAIIATKKRINNKILKMYVEGTRIKRNKLTDYSPLLKVIFEYRYEKAKTYM